MDKNEPCQRIFGGDCPECDKINTMDKIDLDAIINTVYPEDGFPITNIPRKDIKSLMSAAIHQALVLASEKATTHRIDVGYHEYETEVDKQSILDVDNLIV